MEFDPEVFTEVLERDYGDASVVGKLYMVQVEETGPYHIDLRGNQALPVPGLTRVDTVSAVCAPLKRLSFVNEHYILTPGAQQVR